jgi:hypothetical protein
VKYFVAQNLFEDGAGLRIVVDELAVDRESAGSGFLGDVQKRQESMIGFAVDAEIVETVTTWQWIPSEYGASRGSPCPPERRAPIAKEITVMELVDSVLEVQPAKQRIGRDLRGTQDVASAVGFDVGEGQKLSHLAIGIGPDPLVDWPHHPIDRRAADHPRHRTS